jgi:hypothetical protein
VLSSTFYPRINPRFTVGEPIRVRNCHATRGHCKKDHLIKKKKKKKKQKKKHNIYSLRFDQGIGNNQRTEGKEGNRNFFDEAQGF